MILNLSKSILEKNGSVHFLKIPSENTKSLGICNPSIYKDGDKLLVNLRNVEYALYHSEGEQKFPSRWGPLAYIHPEDDSTLRTVNFLCELDSKNLNITNFSKIDTFELDVEPIWTFIGLEDGRLVKWDNKLFLIGVRRDTTTNGEGRMEFSEIENNKEIKRTRIQHLPTTGYSYCEKNWMPILDMPYCFVKWTNPTEVVKANLEKNSAEQVFLGHNIVKLPRDIRGGSQVIPYKGFRIAIIHEVELYKSEGGFKDAQYYHRFIVWDKNWNIVKTSEDFKFFTSNIEFACGIVEHEGNILVTVGLQDSSAYLIRIPEEYFDELIGFNNKLENFPTVNFITHELLENRKIILEKELEGLKIKYNSFVATKEQDDSNIVSGKYISSLNTRGIQIATSHLRALKYWYDNTNEEYGLFTEDDISFETIKYWNFTWNSFIKELPTNWDCIQLCRIRENGNDLEFRKRLWDDWSVTAYLITRNYVKKLLEQYYIDDSNFSLEIPNTNLMPIIENLIYTSSNVYSFPLFIEKIEAGKSNNHSKSSEIVLNLWKNIKSNKFENIKIHPLLKQAILEPYNATANILLGEHYYVEKHYASALAHFLRGAERSEDSDIVYEGLIKAAQCLGKLGRRPFSEESLLINAITYHPQRPEAYFFISQYYEKQQKWFEAYNFAAIGKGHINNKKETITNIEYPGDYVFTFLMAINANRLKRIEESRSLFFELATEHNGELVGYYRNTTQQAMSILGRKWKTKVARVDNHDYVYRKSEHSKLRFKFPGSENIEMNYSQVYQDLFVLSMLNGKRNGTYLEIASGDPYFYSNTAVLEKEFGWTGVGVEIKESDVIKYRANRSNPVLQEDATKLDYKEVLKQHNLPKTIDYLQLDCEPPHITYEILTKIPFDEYKFAVITFETDNYATLDKVVRKDSRKLLRSKGYQLLVSNMNDFEDWWVHPDLVDPKIIELMKNDNDEIKDAREYMLNQ